MASQHDVVAGHDLTPQRTAQPTREELAKARVEASAHAWREARARTAGWPADLAAAESRRTAETFGSEPGADASARQAAALVAATPGATPAECGPVSSSTMAAVNKLMAGTPTPEQEAAALAGMRPPRR